MTTRRRVLKVLFVFKSVNFLPANETHFKQQFEFPFPNFTFLFQANSRNSTQFMFV